VSGTDPLITRLTKAAEAVTGDDQRATTFARGLLLGALVGAAIAGSTIWQRRRQAGPGSLASANSVAASGDDVGPRR
jgi:hypothetical protein